MFWESNICLKSICQNVNIILRSRQHFVLETLHSSCYQGFTPQNMSSDYSDLMSRDEILTCIINTIVFGKAKGALLLQFFESFLGLYSVSAHVTDWSRVRKGLRAREGIRKNQESLCSVLNSSNLLLGF